MDEDVKVTGAGVGGRVDELADLASAFYRENQDFLVGLYGRWQDEKEYESPEDYAAAVRDKVVAAGLGDDVQVRLTRSPFGFRVLVPEVDSVFWVTVNSREYRAQWVTPNSGDKAVTKRQERELKKLEKRVTTGKCDGREYWLSRQVEREKESPEGTEKVLALLAPAVTPKTNEEKVMKTPKAPKEPKAPKAPYRRVASILDVFPGDPKLLGAESIQKRIIEVDRDVWELCGLLAEKLAVRGKLAYVHRAVALQILRDLREPAVLLDEEDGNVAWAKFNWIKTKFDLHEKPEVGEGVSEEVKANGSDLCAVPVSDERESLLESEVNGPGSEGSAAEGTGDQNRPEAGEAPPLQSVSGDAEDAGGKPRRRGGRRPKASA